MRKINPDFKAVLPITSDAAPAARLESTPGGCLSVLMYPAGYLVKPVTAGDVILQVGGSADTVYSRVKPSLGSSQP